MRRGQIRAADYKRIAKDSREPEKVARWREEVERKVVGPPWLVKGASPDDPTIWERIREWLVANWPMILKIILSLLMFVEEPKLRDVEESDDKKDDKKDDDDDEKERPDYKLS
jgi:hypothetical protein